MTGPRKYTKEFNSLLSKLKADGVILIVANGPEGDGFEMAFKYEHMMSDIPEMLRDAANQIERELCSKVVVE